MGYWDYLLRKLKDKAVVAVGIIIFLFGFLMIRFNKFGYVFLLLGLGLIVYGALKMNEFDFNRENPHRVYHHKGKYR